ncbi:exodeoxyribonuclease VII large subunit [Candidatus Saccharibacteria bacterium]|nr:exodeoxyribonuclease VII large subunit [Candidatus Saccharibacteria bacterium]
MLPLLSPSEFVALVNQTLEFAYPLVEIEGEVSNFKISKNRWVYFDIQDEGAKVRCFGTVYMLPAPVEDGMMVRLVSIPKLHPQFGFSCNLQSLQFSGEGTIKKASDLLAAQLEKEGLFAAERKRQLPYPPQRIALIASSESAGYKDFLKILESRYGGMEIELADVQVQGEAAVQQIVSAIEWFNKQADLADVIVLTRGGGSADDLQAFSSEQVTRAVASSRIPTIIAIGHEVDISLAELAADKRASTPSNAAEILVPDRRALLQELSMTTKQLERDFMASIVQQSEFIHALRGQLDSVLQRMLTSKQTELMHLSRTLEVLSPQAILRRGYSIVRSLDGRAVRIAKSLRAKDMVKIEFADGNVEAKVQ